MRVSRILVSFISLLLSATVRADANTLDLLPKLLAKPTTYEALEVNTETVWEVAFCPDNTCDLIQAPVGTPEKAIGDFSFLYLYYASGYIYLKDFYLKDARPHASAVLARNAASCAEPEEFARAACAMNSLAQKYRFKVGLRRYDEGAVLDDFEGAEEPFTEASIRATKEWQEKQWKSSP